MSMKLTLPELCLVLLVGPSGAGKSTFARKHFLPTEVLSSDFFRAVVADDEANQACSRDAFDLLHFAIAKRLTWRRFTVVDATNVQPDKRKALLRIARDYHYLLAAIVFDLPEAACRAHNRRRPDRAVPEHVIASHRRKLDTALTALENEGYHHLYVLSSPEEVEAAVVERMPMPFDKKHLTGPFDLIGDVHGCLDELARLLEKLGYTVACQPDIDGCPCVTATPPPGRLAVFVGDLVDRGPDVPGVLRLVIDMARRGHALCVLGNHDNKLLRKLAGHDVKVSHGLMESLRQLEGASEDFTERVRAFLADLPHHLVLDRGKLVVAHAGLRQDLQGRTSSRVRSFALFGDTTGERDGYGLPVRRDWAAEYHGHAAVVYGHTPVAEAVWVRRTINIDTGCVFGGRLTALRYPEEELVEVPAVRTYTAPPRPFLGEAEPSPDGATRS
jgi:protein phosphatase